MTAYRPCVLCAGTARVIEYRFDFGTVVRCRGCDLVSMVEPRGTNLVRCAYDAGYYRRGDGPGPGYTDYFGSEAGDRRAIAGALADLVLRVAPDGRRCLDLGCGGGFLVHALAARGMAAFGADTSDHAVRHTGTGPGRFVLGDVASQAVAVLAPFDVITMIDVIEHLPDPVSDLRHARSLLRPGGVILLLTPRYGGRLLGEQDAAYVHFNTDHIYYFTEQTLRAVIGDGVGCRHVVVDDVLGMLSEWNVTIPRLMARKYGVERESMLASVIV
ncbi:class I SAM-dependent methyltransferase [Actinomadura rugatobispora]|uniref:Class I SAM-dependent methyltransferase n=1 Tax=Actinomadura rugatobispora TaxID=1994 RepID=A0ABW1AJ07_9ACTN|nr:hypothetical protein GCM10010200_057470 [Actinomadura rugatobispora]